MQQETYNVRDFRQCKIIVTAVDVPESLINDLAQINRKLLLLI